jgi:hypothetical protein
MERATAVRAGDHPPHSEVATLADIYRDEQRHRRALEDEREGWS